MIPSVFQFRPRLAYALWLLSACNSPNTSTAADAHVDAQPDAVRERDGSLATDAHDGSSGDAHQNSGPANWVHLDMNDVSILFRPTATNGSSMREEVFAELPPISTSGIGGALLSQAQFEIAEPNEISRNQLPYASWKLVSIRIDPCFRKDDGTCDAQVRLVAQTPAAETAALHMFYSLSPDSFRGLLQRLVALRNTNGGPHAGDALQVHPLLAQQGNRGPFAANLLSIFLEHIGAANLSRVAIFSEDTQLTLGIWPFRIFDVQNGILSPRNILRSNEEAARVDSIVDNLQQNLRLTLSKARHSSKTLVSSVLDECSRIDQPGPIVEPPWTEELSGDRANFSPCRIDQNVARESHTLALRLENPRLTATADFSCAGCHAATGYRNFVEGRFPSLEGSSEGRFDHAGNLEQTGTANLRTHTSRMFGFEFDSDGNVMVAIAPRTIHESALVVDELEEAWFE